MDTEVFDMNDIDIAWCPGCGNYPDSQNAQAGVGPAEN